MEFCEAELQSLGIGKYACVTVYSPCSTSMTCFTIEDTRQLIDEEFAGHREWPIAVFAIAYDC